MTADQKLQISESAYKWSVRAFSTVKRMLGVNIKLHSEEFHLGSGHIFLFNHFARFETFIPQYLIYDQTGAYCRSIASAEFFTEDAFGAYLYSLGAVPNDMPGLLPFLACEILRGRKVVVFPEGGMVKDRRVVDPRGGYSIFSRTANERRKHHTGAAVLALTLEVLKTGLLGLEARGEAERLRRWARALGMHDADELLAAARHPTLIVPANITFYPIRITDNLLRRGMELFAQGMDRRFVEEALIEGNILLKDTDMDIRLGEPVRSVRLFGMLDRWLARRVVVRAESVERLFALKGEARRWDERLLARRLAAKALVTRDNYMHGMYAAVTVNLCHLAAPLLLGYVGAGFERVAQCRFHLALYLLIKRVQADSGVHLHRSLRDPDAYRGLVEDGDCPGLGHFMDTNVAAGLVAREDPAYRFLPKLKQDHGFDAIRLENPLAVYANEVAPIAAVREAIGAVREAGEGLDQAELSRHLYDDETRSFLWDRASFTKPRHAAVNATETATESGEPYLLLPDGQGSGLGVVVVHGFLASPAELRALGEKLWAQGHAVIGVRLKGHGTSPWDLRERRWTDWMASVRRGYRIMAGLVPRVAIVGFSSGGALGLRLAAEHPEKLAGVVSACAPLRFRNRNLILVPLVHGANELTRWLSSYEGVMPFRTNDSEHPAINYRNIPIRGLYELRRMVDDVEAHLPEVRCPVTVIQSTGDHVVDPKSAQIIFDKLGANRKMLHHVDSKRHGIVNEDVGPTHRLIVDFVADLAAEAAAMA